MPDWKSLATTLWLASSLALLASILIAPIRTSASLDASGRRDGLRRTQPLPPPGQPATRLVAATKTDSDPQIKALLFEKEEKDGADALDDPRESFRVSGTFRKVPDRRLLAPRSILSPYPLLC